MKKESGNKIRLGAFVFIGLALFVIGIYYIGAKQQLFNKTFRLRAVFSNVTGLQVGNNVRFSGINVGTIENIEIINDTSVRVDMIVEEKTREFIKKDARASIGSDGLMGNKIMNILPGNPEQPVVEHDDYIAIVPPINMDEVIGNLKLTTDNAALITSDLSAITDNIRTGRGTIGKLFMDTVFAENLDRTLINVRKGAKGFQQNMDAAKNSILLRGYFKKQEKANGEKKGE